MQHDLFKNITEIEKKYLKDWISLQTRFETKFSNKDIKGKAKQDLIDALRLESDDFLGEMPLKLFVSDYFVKCLLEQKHSMLDGESIVKYIAKDLLEDDEFLESTVSLYPRLVKSIAPERKRNRRCRSRVKRKESGCGCNIRRWRKGGRNTHRRARSYRRG